MIGIECEVCDFTKVKRIGRMKYQCVECGSDVTFEYLLWCEQQLGMQKAGAVVNNQDKDDSTVNKE